jgi:integrase
VNGKVDVNPARSVRQRAEGSGRLRYLSDDEYDRLHKVVAEKFPQYLSELIVSLQTGMRLTEQYTLTWGQVHFDRKAIELTKAKNGSARTVHLNSEVISTLQSLKAPNRLKSDLVFPRLGTEGRFDTRSWFVPCLAAAKIEGYVWHSNRHTFCSRLAMAGATIKEIQEAAGHKTITMSARYAHLSPKHQQSVLERITTAAYKH